MNKFDFALYVIFFNIYLLVCWIAPLAVIDCFDNRWLNVIAFHVVIVAVVGFAWFVGYAASKSNNFRG